MRKKFVVLGSGFMGLLFLCGFQGPAVAQTLQPDSDKKADPCLESTCRNIPVREELTAIDIRGGKSGIKHLRGIAGGFEQGAGVAGGTQFTTADAIPHLELRATALTSTTLVRRLDLEGVFTFADSRNHADVWFSFMQRQNDFFGIGPLTSIQSKTSFGTDQRSYQASVYRDLADHLQAGLYGQVKNSHSEASNSTKYPPITESFSGTPDQGAARWIPGFPFDAANPVVWGLPRIRHAR